MNTKWRPMMGWMYMVVCITDFVIFPVLWSLIQALHGGRVETQWSPITLNGAGLFHMAMGAILGIAVYGRTQEKMAGTNISGQSTASVGVGSAISNVWQPGSANNVINSIPSEPRLSRTGKPMPAEPAQPEL